MASSSRLTKNEGPLPGSSIAAGAAPRRGPPQGALSRSRGARSETGYVRSANEDRMDMALLPFGDVYVVSDGMGGYKGGALAAELTVRTLKERLSALSPESPTTADDVRQAFLAANAEVYRRRTPEDPETCNMGATGVALITDGVRAIVGHVGDSRVYLWRRRRDLSRLTRDHSKVQRMVDDGIVTPKQAETHPDASVLDRAIGHQPIVEVDVTEWLALKPGDMILLCTDGLCGYASDTEIARVLETSGDPRVLVDRLIDLALGKGGEDNVTVQLVRFGSVSFGPLSGQSGKTAAGVLGAVAVVLGAVGLGVVLAPYLVAPAEQPVGETSKEQQQVAQLLLDARQLKDRIAANETKLVELTGRLQAVENARLAAPGTVGGVAPTVVVAPPSRPAPKPPATKKKNDSPPAAGSISSVNPPSADAGRTDAGTTVAAPDIGRPTAVRSEPANDPRVRNPSDVGTPNGAAVSPAPAASRPE